MIKFLIVGENNIDKKKVVKLLLNNKDLFNVANYFTTNEEESNKEFHYYLSNKELHICYKNNALLFIKTLLYDSYGITLDSFYESNLIFMNTEDFNNISNKIFLSNNELIIIWLDTKNHDHRRLKKEMKESTYLLEKINEINLKYLYFLDIPEIEVMDVIVEYLKNSESREELLEKYS